jgi:cell division control protein 42
MRPLAYPETDVFLVCFSVAAPASLASVRETWLPELHHFFPRVPRVLVGTQVDLREDPHTIERLEREGLRPVSTEDGERRAREIGAAKYVECSALAFNGVQHVFDEARLPG